MLSAKGAKDLLRTELKRRGIKHGTMRAKTVSFSDLARADKVFVSVQGVELDPFFISELKEFCQKNGFIVDFGGLVS